MYVRGAVGQAWKSLSCVRNGVWRRKLGWKIRVTCHYCPHEPRRRSLKFQVLKCGPDKSHRQEGPHLPIRTCRKVAYPLRTSILFPTSASLASLSLSLLCYLVFWFSLSISFSHRKRVSSPLRILSSLSSRDLLLSSVRTGGLESECSGGSRSSSISDNNERWTPGSGPRSLLTNTRVGHVRCHAGKSESFRKEWISPWRSVIKRAYFFDSELLLWSPRYKYAAFSETVNHNLSLAFALTRVPAVTYLFQCFLSCFLTSWCFHRTHLWQCSLFHFVFL